MSGPTRANKIILRDAPGGPYVLLEACAVHLHGCRACKWRKPGPCNCGAAELWERARDAMIQYVEQAPEVQP